MNVNMSRRELLANSAILMAATMNRYRLGRKELKMRFDWRDIPAFYRTNEMFSLAKYADNLSPTEIKRNGRNYGNINGRQLFVVPVDVLRKHGIKLVESFEPNFPMSNKVARQIEHILAKCCGSSNHSVVLLTLALSRSVFKRRTEKKNWHTTQSTRPFSGANIDYYGWSRTDI